MKKFFTIALAIVSIGLYSQNMPIGFLDTVNYSWGGGWAYDPDAGTTPIEVHIYVDGRFYTSKLANEYRPDLVSAGVAPDPYHGYTFTLTGIDTNIPHEIMVYAINYPSGPNPVLSNCPKIIGTVPNGNASISALAGPSPIVITTTHRTAGAIASLTWLGKEFIDSYDHGRELQSATSFDGYGECYNPTEAGSQMDGTGPTSSSLLQYIHAQGNYLETQILAAFWIAPGDSSPFCGHPVNTTVRSGHIFRKKVKIGMPGMAHVIKYNTEFDLPANYDHGVFEVLTGYMPTEFAYFYTYNPETQVLTPLSDGPGEQDLPVIFSTQNQIHSMGIYSPYLPQAEIPWTGYGRFRFPDCTKWNCVFRKWNVSPGVHKFLCYVMVGSLDNVKTSMNQLFDFLRITADFNHAVTNSSSNGITVQFDENCVGSYEETAFYWDIYNDGTVDGSGQQLVYTFPGPGTYAVKLTATNGVANAHNSSIVKNIVLDQTGVAFVDDQIIQNLYYNRHGKPVKVDVLDLSSRLVFSEILNPNEKLNLAGRVYKPGFYLIKITGNNFSYSQKWINNQD